MVNDGVQLSAQELSDLVLELRAEVDRLSAEVRSLREENDRLRKENESLRRQLQVVEQKKNPTTRLDEAYSARAEKKRQQKSSGRKKKKSQKPKGRRPTAEKIEQADEHQTIVPDGLTVSQCTFVRERPVWRIVDGQARRIVYEIWQGPEGQIPKIPGVAAKSEFGIEVIVAVAWLNSVPGLSLDHTCAVIWFFWNLKLSKSQADAFLNQLAARWQEEFDLLCEMIANSMVVHADETSWSIRSVWAFLSEKAHVLLFGCRKDGETLSRILNKETFSGVVISDDASVYRGFSKAQKCWAHLLRKAIRQSLLFPDNADYARFRDGLFDVFERGIRASKDGRLNDLGRQRRIVELESDLVNLCQMRFGDAANEPPDEDDRDFTNLVHEVSRLVADNELFTFIKHSDVDATNNEAERSLRGSARARKTGQTSKTVKGARRRSVIMSVFESLRLHLEDFSLGAIVEQVSANLHTGKSLFRSLQKRSTAAVTRLI